MADRPTTHKGESESGTAPGSASLSGIVPAHHHPSGEVSARVLEQALEGEGNASVESRFFIMEATSTPIPDPAMCADYERSYPGATARLFDDYLEGRQHSREMESKAVELEFGVADDRRRPAARRSSSRRSQP